MLAAAYQQELRFSEDAAQKIKDMRNQLASYQEPEDKVKKLRREGARIFEQLLQSLSQNSSAQNAVRRYGEDTCIVIYIHFETDKDEIFNGDERGALKKTSPILKQAPGTLPADYRKDIEVIIDGDTDSRAPEKETDPIKRYRYDWDLSAARAASVASVFHAFAFGAAKLQNRGRRPRRFATFSWLRPREADCYDKNRRTTLRLRADTLQIESRLKRQTRSIQ